MYSSNLTEEQEMSSLTDNEMQEIDEDSDLAWELTEDLMEDCLEGNEPIGVIFGVWVNLIHFLVARGYTKEELQKDLEWHVENASSEGLA